MKNNKYHIPVLLNESLDNLVYDPKGLYVDATFGGGGHSIFLLNKLHPAGRLIAFDQDKESIKNCISDPRFKLFNTNFRYIYKTLTKYNVYQISGIIADLGVSSHQLDDLKRGFSTQLNNELDMRMDKSSEKSAKKILNSYSEEMLTKLFYNNGELSNARNIAKKIIIYRKKKYIDTTLDLITSIKKEIPKIVEKKIWPQVFQAIRIEVNDEINALKELLKNSYNLLKMKGRIVIISYHSLEDRLIKKVFSNKKIRSKGIIKPNTKEIILNPRASSAKMRIAEKIK